MQGLHPLGQLARPGFEQVGQGGQLGPLLHGAGIGVPAGDGFNAPHPGGHAAFGNNQEGTGLARTGKVRAAAQFHGFRRVRRRVGHGQHAHGIAVFFAEQGHGSAGHGLGHGHDFGADGHVRQNGAVDLALYSSQLFRGQGRNVGKVKTQMRAVHQGARLLDVAAQHPAQGRVQQMGAGVVAGRGRALVGVHGQFCRVAQA